MNPCIIIKLRMKSQPNLVLILHTDNFAVILGEHGSGLGDFADRLTIDAKIPYGEIPHFPVSTVAGHAGCFLLGKVGDCPVLNFRRRSARERENIYADVRCETLKKFLPVYDSLSRALAQTPADDPARKGIEGIKNQYHTALNQLGVSEIEAVGKPFDANRHNAVMHIEDDAYGEGVVVEEFEKGFCIGDRVLRYSVVKVAN